MSVREIITIQCGHYSNFVGTHWWNLQESSFCYDESKKETPEIRHDCMFREGITLDGEQTYIPRLIAVDRSGSLRTLKQHGDLYDAATTHVQAHVQEGQVSWTGKMKKYEAEPPTKNEFLSDLHRIDSSEMEAKVMEAKTYALHNEVKVWSDFLRIHLHPRSVVTVPDVFHGDDSCFTVFPAGEAAWTSKFQDTFEEHLHFFLEECDSLQGFHLLADAGDGFGGLASCIAEELADQFSQKGQVSFMTSPDSIPFSQTPRFHSALLSNAMCLDGLCSSSSLTCPLYLLEEPWRNSTCPSHKVRDVLRHEHTLPYHSAAIFASALETSTLIYRTYQGPHSLPSMADTLTKRGRKVCAMGLALPFPLPPDSALLSELDLKPLHTQLQPLTPFCSTKDGIWSQAITLRGLPLNYPVCSKQDERHSYCSFHPSLALGTHISTHLPQCSACFTVVNKPLTLGNPFPPILQQTHLTAREVPACASFQSQSGLLCMMESLSTELKRLDVRLVPSFAESSLNIDSYGEMKERLLSLEDCYRTTRQSNETSDSD